MTAFAQLFPNAKVLFSLCNKDKRNAIQCSN